MPRWVYKLKVRKMSNVGYLGCVQSWESGIPSCGFSGVQDEREILCSGGGEVRGNEILKPGPNAERN